MYIDMTPNIYTHIRYICIVNRCTKICIYIHISTWIYTNLNIDIDICESV